MVAALAAAQAEMARQGLSTVVEAGMNDLVFLKALRAVEEQGLSKVRWQVRVTAGCYAQLDADPSLAVATPWVEVLGVKLYSDGYLGSHVAALVRPYSDMPGWYGVLAYDADTALHHVRAADGRGYNVATHAIGDRSATLMLDAYEAAGVTPAKRWSIEHAQVLPPALIDRMAAAGVVASIQFSFATTDQHFAEDRLGDRIDDAYQWRTLLASGVPVAGGTDYPIEVLHPLWGVERTVTRQELDGSAAWRPEEALSVEQALRAITWGQAYGSGEEHERGSIGIGKWADLVVLGADPFTVPPSELADLPVRLAVTNGQVTFEGEAAYPPANYIQSGATRSPQADRVAARHS